VDRDPVLEFLLRCTTYPRSAAHCLNEVETSLKSLPRYKEPMISNRKTSELVASVAPETLDQEGLHAHIDALQLAIVETHGVIADTYFRSGE
jgi:uncharacterized alpha-E superfamily protein